MRVLVICLIDRWMCVGLVHRLRDVEMVAELTESERDAV